jgi:glutamine cyclotransferase
MRFSIASSLLAAIVLFLASCGGSSSSEKDTDVDSTLLSYTVLSVLPHNAEAFTQGLVIHNNKLLESTGQEGRSWVGEVNPASGAHDKKIILDNKYFGEGITVLNSKLYYLTWKKRVGFVYNATTYEKIKEFEYDPKIKEAGALLMMV